ncbi:MAG: pyridoxamine 5'-phosphate oxidase family protein [Acidobacteriota bacterium]
MIDTALASFLQGSVSIHVGTRNERLEPSGTPATAARVEDDGRHLVVFVPAAAAPRIVPNLEANGHAAVVFVRPIDEKACQVKGTFTGVRSARDDERPLIERQWGAFLGALEHIGVGRALVQSWLTWPAVAVGLRVTAIFDQTPGKNAGAPLV